MSYKKIGVIVADKDEYKPFVKTAEQSAVNVRTIETPFNSAMGFSCGNSEVMVVLCGIGKVNAATAAMYLVNSGCDALLNFGLSGGLAGVSLGEFIVPGKFLEHDFDLTGLGYKPCEKPGQDYIYSADEKLCDCFSSACKARITGTAVCGDRFISSNSDKEFLISTFSASSCDMETAAIASVCHITNTPFVSLRRISDGADDKATETYRDMNVNDGTTLSETFMKCLKGVTNV
ncbi:MAG: 5'-methylthioadenosine/S-adenosylhomocysteine nucleosidase [Clostridia bacterium]|nr:5'-methylthioadenosine/S-adenosylhomocysteine nucleosidase [Clostridia bacterium]